MKNIFKVQLLSLLFLSFLMINSCTESSEIISEQQEVNEALSLEELDSGINLKHGNNCDDYDIVIAEELVQDENCDDEYVSGIIEFYYDGELILSIDFGDGSCDGTVTLTYLNFNGQFLTEDICICDLFDDDDDDDEYEDCFEIVYPISFTMPDESVLTIESEDELTLLWEWYEENPGNFEEPILNFPIDVVYPDGTTETVNSEEELEDLYENCEDDDDDDCDGGHGNNHGDDDGGHNGNNDDDNGHNGNDDDGGHNGNDDDDDDDDDDDNDDDD